MLQIHANALDCTNVTYHEFLIRYKANCNIVYGLIEGKDDPMFYRGIIERELPSGWDVELIPAGSKINVINAERAFDWGRFSRKRVCFFVDRDLSVFTQEESPNFENLYITDGYSIENDIVSYGLAKRLLIEVFNFSDLSQAEIEKIEKKFTNSFVDFKEKMTPLMAQILLWRRGNKKLHLKNIKPKDYFYFDCGEIKSKGEFETSMAVLQHAANCASLSASQAIEVSNAELEFRGLDGCEKFIRGKYVLWFLVEFVICTHRDIQRIFSRFTASPKARISVGQANAMVVVAPRARCPVSLQSFLRRNYGEYIAEFMANLSDTESFADTPISI